MTLYDQLTEYCGCVEVKDTDVEELIITISSVTGWTRRPCETLEVGDRKEIIDLPSCMDCPMEFTPYYHPFDPESFKFYLVEIDGLVETKTEITDFAYSETDELFRVDTGLPKCGCVCTKCGCEPKYKLVVTYSAGYEEIPECLLPVFCNVLEVIHAKNECDCSCGCEGDENGQTVRYAQGDVVSVALETDIGKMLVMEYKNELARLMLTVEPQFWGFVV